MNAQQIYLCMYFTMWTALIGILNIIKSGMILAETISYGDSRFETSKNGVHKTELQQEA